MIASLDDLREFTKRLAASKPLISKELLLRSPGCSDMEVRELLAFEPNLPPIYLNCIRRVALKGAGLSAHFLIWPGHNFRKGTFVEDFKEAQAPGSLDGYEAAAALGMFIAASWAGDTVAVGKVGSPMGTDVVYLFRYSDTQPVHTDPIRLCSDFERFLIAAGDLAELFLAKTVPERDMELARRLRIIGLSEAEVQSWLTNTAGLFE
jgi:hypothetical protein